MKSDDKGPLICLGLVLAVAAIGTAIVYGVTHRAARPPDPAEDLERTVAFVAGKAFAEMPLAQQRAYVEKMRSSRSRQPGQPGTQADRGRDAANGGPQTGRQETSRSAGDSEIRTCVKECLNPKQRKAFYRNTRKVREAERNAWLDRFFAMSREEQIAELDRRIAEQTVSRARHPKRRSRWSPQRRRNRDERVSPAIRAKKRAYARLKRLRKQGLLK